MQEARLDPRILRSLILMILALCAQPAAWGQTAVTCTIPAGSVWTDPAPWGLNGCYPDAGVCGEPTWFVTLDGCGMALDTSPSVASLTIVNGSSLSTGPSAGNLTVSGLTRLGFTTINFSGDLIAAGPLEIVDRPRLVGTNLQSHSLATMNGTVQISATNPSTFQNLGTWNMSGNTAITGSGVFLNDGDFHKLEAGTSSRILPVFHSAGSIDVEAGSLRILGGGFASNAVEVHAGATLEFESPYQITGTLFGDGNVRIENNAVIDSSGTWDVTGLTEILSGSIHFANAGTQESLDMSFGTLTGDLVINGHLDWTGGTMAAPGTTWINGFAEITADTINPKLDGRTLEVNVGAIVNLLGPGNDLWGVNGASVYNRGIVHVAEGIPFLAAAPTDASFDNEGRFLKSGSNTALVQFEFLNHGTVDVMNGGLTFAGDYVQSANPSTVESLVTQLSGGAIGDTGSLVDIQEGFLQGGGEILPAVQSTGVLSPGVASMDMLFFGDTLTLGPGSAMEFELGAATGQPGVAHDAITVLDTLVLDGDLLVTFANGFESLVQPGDTFDLATVFVNPIQGQLAGQPNGSQLFTADGFGSFTVEYGPGATEPHVLRLTNYQPATPNPAGSVPDGDDGLGVPFQIEKATGTEITLSWGSSCASGDTDYEIYQGEIGDYYSHVKMDPCSTGGATTATFAPPPSVSTYYLVVPTNGTNEGSYGLRSDDTERPQPLHPADRCRPQQVVAVCQ